MSFFARTVTPGNGSTQDFTLSWPYLNASTVQVYLVQDAYEETPADLLAVTTDYTFTSSSVVHFLVAPPAGHTVVIKRVTPAAAIRKSISPGTISSSDLNQDFLQLLYLSQEAADRVLALDDRAVQLAFGDTGGVLPSKEALEGLVLGVVGGAIVGVPNDATAVTAAVIAAEAAATSAGADAVSTASDRDYVTKTVLRLNKVAEQNTDLVVTSSTAIVDVPGLHVPLAANSLTTLRGRLLYTASSTGGLRYRLTGPASPASVNGKVTSILPGATGNTDSFVTAYSGADVQLTGGSTGLGWLEFDLTIHNGATAGNFGFSFGQAASHGTSTVILAGDYIEYALRPTTADIPFSATGLAKLGAFSGPTLDSGHNVRLAIGWNGIAHSYIEGRFRGTDLLAQLPNGTYAVDVDFVTQTPLVVSAGWSFPPIFTGLDDVEHQVRITGQVFDDDIAFKLSGTAPSVIRPPEIPNIYTIAGNPYIASDGYAGLDPLYSPVSPSNQIYWTQGNGFGHRFNATTTSVRLWLYDGAAASGMVLLQDGTPITPVMTPPRTGGNYQIFTIATGLSGTHDYEIVFIDKDKTAYSYQLLVDTLNPVTQTAREVDVHFGDSITALQAIQDARQGDAYLTAHAQGRAAYRVGVGGTTMYTYGRDNTATATAIPGVTRLYWRYGTNDAFFGTSTANLQAAYTTALATARVALPTCDFRVELILPSTRTNITPIASCNTAIIAAVAARVAAGDTHVGYRDISSGFNTATHTVDGTHPNGPGYGLLDTNRRAAW